jgi:hypothetical protein
MSEEAPSTHVLSSKNFPGKNFPGKNFPSKNFHLTKSSRPCYNSHMNEIEGAKPFVPQPAAPVAPVVTGHRVTVKGFYLAAPNAKDKNGHDQKRRVAYEEIFDLEPQGHNFHGPGALGHLLRDSLLAERLYQKDPEFRAIATHEVVKHETL